MDSKNNEQVIETVTKTKKKKKSKIVITQEEIDRVNISKDGISITKFCENINKARENPTKKIQATHITSWLLEKKLLHLVTNDKGKQRRLPTGSGREIGITPVMKNTVVGRTEVNIYSAEAQQFILDHLLDMFGIDYKSSQGKGIVVKIKSVDGQDMKVESDVVLGQEDIDIISKLSLIYPNGVSGVISLVYNKKLPSGAILEKVNFNEKFENIIVFVHK